METLQYFSMIPKNTRITIRRIIITITMDSIVESNTKRKTKTETNARPRPIERQKNPKKNPKNPKNP